MRLDRFSLVAALAAVLVLGQACFDARAASAQCDPASETCTTVGADGKGILGGGIIGAEIGFIIPALIVNAGVRELDEWWAWVLFPALGAAGGAVAGYFALEEPVQAVDATGTPTQRGFPEAAVAVLAVGMALIVPTFVGVLALTSYNPGPDDGGQGASGDEDAQEGGGEAEESASASAIRRTLAGGPGVLRFDRGQLLLGLPMVRTASSFTAEEQARMRLGNMQDFLVPVVSGVF